MRRAWLFRLRQFLLLALAVIVIATLAVFLGLFERSAVGTVMGKR
ncbi:hypothetical protein [Mesorhizobium escarrei]|nr:hypothetical protein [Mesorhizobium escarrei]